MRSSTRTLCYAFGMFTAITLFYSPAFADPCAGVRPRRNAQGQVMCPVGCFYAWSNGCVTQTTGAEICVCPRGAGWNYASYFHELFGGDVEWGPVPVGPGGNDEGEGHDDGRDGWNRGGHHDDFRRSLY